MLFPLAITEHASFHSSAHRTDIFGGTYFSHSLSGDLPLPQTLAAWLKIGCQKARSRILRDPPGSKCLYFGAQTWFFLTWAWHFHTHSSSCQTVTYFWKVSDSSSYTYLVHNLDFLKDRIYIWFNNMTPDPSTIPGTTQILHTHTHTHTHTPFLDEWVNTTFCLSFDLKPSTTCSTDLTPGNLRSLTWFRAFPHEL